MKAQKLLHPTLSMFKEKKGSPREATVLEKGLTSDAAKTLR